MADDVQGVEAVGRRAVHNEPAQIAAEEAADIEEALAILKPLDDGGVGGTEFGEGRVEEFAKAGAGVGADCPSLIALMGCKNLLGFYARKVQGVDLQCP